MIGRHHDGGTGNPRHVPGDKRDFRLTREANACQRQPGLQTAGSFDAAIDQAGARGRGLRLDAQTRGVR